MQDCNIFIKEQIKIIDGILINPDIPEKKLNNALKAFECEDSKNSIIALYDNTLFKSAKEGLVFTGEKMIFKSSKPALHIPYKDITQVQYYEKNIQVKENKSESIQGIKISTDKQEFVLEKNDLPNSLYKPLEIFLQKLITEVKDFKEVELLKPLEAMPSELKLAYMKIIINISFENGEYINEKEFTEIYALMTRIKLSKEERYELRTYITEIKKDNMILTNDLMTIIKENCEAIHFEELMISLVKDLFNVYASAYVDLNEKENKIPRYELIEKHKELFGLSPEKINLATTAVENDLKILYEDIDDDKIKELVKDLAAKAAGVGVPIGAVYISGSVVGLSAAGMTSGLATLGLGLGMATGIGTAVLLGVGVYQGVKYLTKDDVLGRYKTRALMLHEVIKQTQKTISLMIDDINEVVSRLNDIITKHNESEAKIKKLTEYLSKFQAALTTMDKKNKELINKENRMKCPIKLDLSRVSFMKDEPTKKEAYDFIISCYEEIKSDDEKIHYVLKENLENDELEDLYKILESIGYFNTTNIVKDKLTSGIKGIFNG